MGAAPPAQAKAYWEATLREVQKYDDLDVEWVYRGKHGRIVLRHGEKSRWVTCPLTPGDKGRGVLNHVRDVRHAIAYLNPPKPEEAVSDYRDELAALKARMTGQAPPPAAAPEPPPAPALTVLQPQPPETRPMLAEKPVTALALKDAIKIGVNLSRMGVTMEAIEDALSVTPDEVCASAWLVVVQQAAHGAAQAAADEAHDRTVKAMRVTPAPDDPFSDDPPPNWKSPEDGRALIPRDVRAWIIRNVRSGRVRNIDAARLFGIASSTVSSVMGKRGRG